MRPILVLVVLLLGGAALGASDSRQQEVQASEILAKIERGEPVEYDNVVIAGDLDLSMVDLPTRYVERTRDEVEHLGLDENAKLVVSSIKIKDSEIRGDVNFGNAIFQESVNFKRAQFSGNAYFRGAQFSEYTSFLDAQFSGYANFRNAQFSGYANFWGAQFSGYAYFWDAQFSGYAVFRNAQFSEDAAFEDVQFSEDAVFEDAQFRGNAYFEIAQFSGNADFKGAQFSGIADFEGAQFNEDANFNNAHFGGDLTLNNSKTYKIRLSNPTFGDKSNLHLTGADFYRLYLRWDDVKDNLAYDGAAYMALVKNFKNLEYFGDADDCYYQYRWESQRRKNWLEWSKYSDLLACAACGYGVRPIRPLILGLSVVVICAVYYRQKDAIRRLKDNGSAKADFKDAFYFSMMTFTTVGYGDWYPQDEHRNLVMFEGILGWLLLSLFLVTLASVMIR